MPCPERRGRRWDSTPGLAVNLVKVQRREVAKHRQARHRILSVRQTPKPLTCFLIKLFAERMKGFEVHAFGRGEQLVHRLTNASSADFHTLG